MDNEAPESKRVSVRPNRRPKVRKGRSTPAELTAGLTPKKLCRDRWSELGKAQRRLDAYDLRAANLLLRIDPLPPSHPTRRAAFAKLVAMRPQRMQAADDLRLLSVMPDHDRRIRTVEAMVRLRQKFEPQSHIVRAPRDLWSTPEYLVYSVLRGIALLQHDGMTELDALRRVDERRGFNQLLGFETPSTEEYLARLLHKTAPRYLWLGPKPLTEAIAVARNGLGKPPEPVWTATVLLKV